MKTLLLISLSMIAGLGVNTPSFALSSDREQPAQIEADETEVDFRTGVRTLTNNVLVVQGTLRLKADKLVANYSKGELVKAIANGSLARFKQRPDGQPDDVEGWAKKIEIDYPTNTIILTGKAALKQGASTATGNKIIYNMATDKLRIMGDSTYKGASKPGSAKPKARLEDPFKDDTQGPAPAAKSAIATTKAANDAAESAESATELAPTEPTAAPIKSGRSRLILQPKKKK